MSLTLPQTNWPSPDRTMWADLQKQGGPLDDRGALVHLRATSLQTLELRYARWLCWLTVKDPVVAAVVATPSSAKPTTAAPTLATRVPVTTG